MTLRQTIEGPRTEDPVEVFGWLVDSGLGEVMGVSRWLDPDDEDDEERIDELCEEHEIELDPRDRIVVLGRSWEGHRKGSIMVMGSGSVRIYG